MKLRLRAGRPEERAALEELQRRSSLVYEEYRDFLVANPDAIQLPLSQLLEKKVWVAELESKAVGFSALLPRGEPPGEIVCDLDGLFVEPELWRRGIGRALMEDAAARAQALGASAIEVVANPRAEAFYLKLGFGLCGRAETMFGPANRLRRDTRDASIKRCDG